MQCVMRRGSGQGRCENDGLPEPGYTFYVCPGCLEELEGLLEAIALREGSLVNPLGRKN